MKIFDKYGFKVEDSLKVKKIFEEISEIPLEPRNSSYKGLYFLNSIPGESERYELRDNYIENEGWSEEKYMDYNVILYISCSSRMNELRDKILKQTQAKVIFIRRTVITEDRWDIRYEYIDGRDILVSKKKLPSIL
jgi:hypothetical protein